MIIDRVTDVLMLSSVVNFQSSWAVVFETVCTVSLNVSDFSVDHLPAGCSTVFYWYPGFRMDSCAVESRVRNRKGRLSESVSRASRFKCPQRIKERRLEKGEIQDKNVFSEAVTGAEC